jgi:hypothetical protein
MPIVGNSWQLPYHDSAPKVATVNKQRSNSLRQGISQGIFENNVLGKRKTRSLPGVFRFETSAAENF